MTKTRDLADLVNGITAEDIVSVGSATVDFTQAGTGAVQRTVESKLQDVVSVKDFGAVGNGVADDTAAIQAAINSAVSQNKGFIYAPTEFIKISSPVDAQGVGIIGVGTTIPNTTNFSNLGPLINCIVRGFRTDVDYIDTLTTGSSTRKIAYRKGTNILSILSKRIGDGYIESEHRYNTYTSNASDAGGSCENWRQCITRLISEVYVCKKTSSAETAGAWGAETSLLISQSFPSGTQSAIPLFYRGTSTVNAEISYEVNASAIGETGYAAIYATASGASSVELYVNGVLQKTFSAVLVGTNYIVPVKYELTLMGTNTITLKNVSGNFLYVIGVEFSTLANLSESADIDYVAYGDYDEDYVSSIGASDYALFSPADGKFFGSIHGGETERSAAIFKVDGDTTTLPASVGDFVFGTVFTLEQFTTIAVGSNSLNVTSTYEYDADSIVDFRCYMSGSATVSTFFTAMHCATTRFTAVRYPVFDETLATGKNLLGRYNTVTQINRLDPTNPINSTVRFTLFPMGGDKGANMGGNGVYISANVAGQTKLYYGPVLDSTTQITEIAFNTTRKFH